jgi:cobalt/nickel transport system permease protein
MADALVSGTVGGVMAVASLATVAFAIKKVKKADIDDRKIPLMGVMGAFVFAAQMINFAIPATGASGHISGGILLAATLGPYPALIAISSVLIIQCLFFADGGLLALGSNIFNMGVITCLIIYPLVFKPIINKGIAPLRITIASVVAVILALQLGAFAVVLETTASGITQLPFFPFLLVMQPIHLAIGIAEGLITAGVLCFIYKMRPEIIDSTMSDGYVHVSLRNVLVFMLLLATLVAGGLSLAVSENPDGLEWSLASVAGTTEIENIDNIQLTATSIRDNIAMMPDYEGASIAGLAGVILTLLLAVILGVGISYIIRRRGSA